jgi:hypothetical protein
MNNINTTSRSPCPDSDKRMHYETRCAPSRMNRESSSGYPSISKVLADFLRPKVL